ncbi:MAG: hypothetical protein U0167_18720 [bacterium]
MTHYGDRTRALLRSGLVVALAAAVLSTPLQALEKRSVIAPADPHGWMAGSTAAIVGYYNTCTDWAWSWYVESGARVGTVFDCPGPGRWTLHELALTFDGSTSQGYGFTGVLSVSGVDSSGCPIGAPLASVPVLPVDGVVTYPFSVAVPHAFLAELTLGYAWHQGGSISQFVTDHPAQGPSGPPACGTCYPETRTTHSFYYGNGSVGLCPGLPFFDGLCNAELLWTASLTGTATAAEETEASRSWSAIKALYR